MRCARAPLAADEFYRQLLADCVATLAASGGGVWQPSLRGKWQLITSRGVVERLDADDPAGQRLIQQAAAASRPQVLLPPGDAFPDTLLLVGAVSRAAPAELPAAVIVLALRSGSSPAVQRGWEEFLAAVCQAAAEFHVHDELRSLRQEQATSREALALVRRLQSGTQLGEVTSDLANEGRRWLGADRLSVLLRRGKRWELQAVSGTEHLSARAERSSNSKPWPRSPPTGASRSSLPTAKTLPSCPQPWRNSSKPIWMRPTPGSWSLCRLPVALPRNRPHRAAVPAC